MAQFLHSFPSVALPFSFPRIISLSQVEVSGPSSCFFSLCSYFYQLLKNLTENIRGLSKQTEYSSAWRKVGKLSNTHCPSDIYAILAGAPFQTWNGKGKNCYIKLHLKRNFKKSWYRDFFDCVSRHYKGKINICLVAGGSNKETSGQNREHRNMLINRKFIRQGNNKTVGKQWTI